MIKCGKYKLRFLKSYAEYCNWDTIYIFKFKSMVFRFIWPSNISLYIYFQEYILDNIESICISYDKLIELRKYSDKDLDHWIKINKVIFRIPFNIIKSIFTDIYDLIDYKQKICAALILN